MSILRWHAYKGDQRVMTFPTPPYVDLTLDELSSLDRNEFRKHFKRLFDLAYAFVPDKGAAINLATPVFKDRTQSLCPKLRF